MLFLFGRFRGWDGLQKTPGSHSILVAPSYENSERGSLLTKLHNQSQSEIRRGKHVYRYTCPEQVAVTVRPPKVVLHGDTEDKGVSKGDRQCKLSDVSMWEPPKTETRLAQLKPPSFTMSSDFSKIKPPSEERTTKGVACTQSVGQVNNLGTSTSLQTHRAFQRLCLRAAEAGSKLLPQKLILSGI